MRWSCLLLLLPLVQAQAPEGATVVVTPGAVTHASLDDPGSVTFTVSFDSPNPIDGQNARTIRVSTSGAPSGWTYALSESDLQLTSGGQATVTVQVAVSADAEAGEAQVNLLAQLVPQSPLTQIPTLGPILDPAAQDQASATIERQDSTTREVIEAVGPWLYVILAALVIAILIAVKVVLDGRRILVALETDGHDVHIGPGKAVAVPVSVRNLGRSEDTIVFHVMTVAKGWAASLPVPELDLGPDASEELQLIIHAPKDAEPGSQQSIGITAHSGAAPRRIAEVVVRVHVT